MEITIKLNENTALTNLCPDIVVIAEYAPGASDLVESYSIESFEKPPFVRVSFDAQEMGQIMAAVGNAHRSDR